MSGGPLRLVPPSQQAVTARLAAPAGPTLIRPLPHKPLQFADLVAMARHIHGLRGARPLQISPLAFASYGGSDTFPGFNLSLVDAETGQDDWIGFAAIQKDKPDALRAALNAALGQAA